MPLHRAGDSLEEQIMDLRCYRRGDRIYFNEYSTTRAVEGGTTVESESRTVSPVRTLRPDFKSEAISE